MEEAIEASLLSTAKVDLVCAYLKRVHFFLYYRGQQCKDEGDMIASRSACRGIAAASKEEVQEVSKAVAFTSALYPSEPHVTLEG